MPTFQELKERLAMAPQRFRVTARVARTSGMLWNWTAPGLREAARSLLKERQSPSQVYRLRAANAPDKVALVWRDQRITFGELDNRLDRIGAALAKRGLARGQGAVARMGGAALSVAWRSTPSELEHLAGHCGEKFIAFEHDLFSTVEQAT